MTLLRASVACLVLISVSAIALAQEEDRVTAALSDPSRPGTLKVGIVMGGITVTGRDIKDIIIEMRGARTKERPVPDEARGLRRLSPSPTVMVEEQNNRVEIVSPPTRTVMFDIQVPKKTNLELSTVNDGSVKVEGVEGELEISNVNGEIALKDVSGAVVAHTVNGRVLATLQRIAPDKPMAFTSLNGAVDVTLPSATKANVRLRTDNGSSFTDFDLQMLPAPDRGTIEETGRSGGRHHINLNKGIYGAVNGGGPEIEMRTFNGNIYLRKGGTPAK